MITGVKQNNKKYRFKTINIDKNEIQMMQEKNIEKQPKKDPKLEKFHKMLEEHRKKMKKDKEKQDKELLKNDPDSAHDAPKYKKPKQEKDSKVFKDFKAKENQNKKPKEKQQGVLGYDKEANKKAMANTDLQRKAIEKHAEEKKLEELKDIRTKSEGQNKDKSIDR